MCSQKLCDIVEWLLNTTQNQIHIHECIHILWMYCLCIIDTSKLHNDIVSRPCLLRLQCKVVPVFYDTSNKRTPLFWEHLFVNHFVKIHYNIPPIKRHLHGWEMYLTMRDQCIHNWQTLGNFTWAMTNCKNIQLCDQVLFL